MKLIAYLLMSSLLLIPATTLAATGVIVKIGIPPTTLAATGDDTATGSDTVTEQSSSGSVADTSTGATPELISSTDEADLEEVKSTAAEISDADLEVNEQTTTPDSPFYFFKRWGEAASLAFTFDPVKKVEKRMKYANRRLKEVEHMVKAGDVAPEAMEKALVRFQEIVQVNEKQIAEIKDNPEAKKLADKMADFAIKRQEILEKLSDELPPRALKHALRSRELQRSAVLKNLGALDGEEKIADHFEKAFEKIGAEKFGEFADQRQAAFFEDLRNDEDLSEAVKEKIKAKKEKSLQKLEQKIRSLKGDSKEKFLQRITGESARDLSLIQELKAKGLSGLDRFERKAERRLQRKLEKHAGDEGVQAEIIREFEKHQGDQELKKLTERLPDEARAGIKRAREVFQEQEIKREEDRKLLREKLSEIKVRKEVKDKVRDKIKQIREENGKSKDQKINRGDIEPGYDGAKILKNKKDERREEAELSIDGDEFVKNPKDALRDIKKNNNKGKSQKDKFKNLDKLNLNDREKIKIKDGIKDLMKNLENEARVPGEGDEEMTKNYNSSIENKMKEPDEEGDAEMQMKLKNFNSSKSNTSKMKNPASGDEAMAEDHNSSRSNLSNLRDDTGGNPASGDEAMAEDHNSSRSNLSNLRDDTGRNPASGDEAMIDEFDSSRGNLSNLRDDTGRNPASGDEAMIDEFDSSRGNLSNIRDFENGDVRAPEVLGDLQKRQSNNNDDREMTKNYNSSKSNTSRRGRREPQEIREPILDLRK